jgi:CRISPR-associated protein Csm1
LLLVGPWQEVLGAGMDVQHAFRRLTGGALTLSAGVGLFDEKYPLVHMARETGRLEDAAKASTRPDGEKDAVSLFGMEAVESGGAQLLVNQHTYSWQELEQQVLGEKYTLLADTLAARPQELGQSFVYALLDLLRRADEEKLNIARLAYLLARRECAASAPQDMKQAYNTFKQRVYEWALSPRDRGQLITALMIYIYTHRTKEES